VQSVASGGTSQTRTVCVGSEVAAAAGSAAMDEDTLSGRRTALCECDDGRVRPHGQRQHEKEEEEERQCRRWLLH